MKMITNNSIIKGEEEAKNEDGIRGSRQWSRLRNPRIVRVPPSFGGKDRHSKVWTVRGLRDRRIRLSVPTAIQLYHLQHKLGVNQPSKVVDWLLDATKQDIDKLPPLHIPPGFGHHQPIHHLLLPAYQSNTCSSKQGLNINDEAKFWDMKISNEQVMKKNDDENEKGKSMMELQKVSSAAQSFFPITNAIHLPPYSNYHENSNLLSLSSQFSTGLLQPQPDNFFNPNPILSFPSSSSSHHHLYMCPTTLPSLFPASYPNEEAAADDTRQVNHFQLLNNAAAAGPSQMPVSRML